VAVVVLFLVVDLAVDLAVGRVMVSGSHRPHRSYICALVNT
jgi:hypothetical protein